jgi:hypothetical protein
MNNDSIIEDLIKEYNFYYSAGQNLGIPLLYREQFAEFALLIAQFIERYDSTFVRRNNA